MPESYLTLVRRLLRVLSQPLGLFERVAELSEGAFQPPHLPRYVAPLGRYRNDLQPIRPARKRQQKQDTKNAAERL